MVLTRLVPLVTWKSTWRMLASPSMLMVMLLPLPRYIPSLSAWPALTLMPFWLRLVVAMPSKAVLLCGMTNSICPPSLWAKVRTFLGSRVALMVLSLVRLTMRLASVSPSLHSVKK